jgi:hypothetical protein
MPQVSLLQTWDIVAQRRPLLLLFMPLPLSLFLLLFYPPSFRLRIAARCDAQWRNLLLLLFLP